MANISDWVKSLDFDTLVSEQDVRTKIAIPLIKLLGYTGKYYADEFPIYSFSGRKRNPTKSVDILCFGLRNWKENRNFESREWVKRNALLSFELKKPSEKLENASGQAEFYSMNARTPFYMVTNGIQLKIFEMNYFSVDRVIYDGNIENLPSDWLNVYTTVSFENILKLKKENSEFVAEATFFEYCTSLAKQYNEMYLWHWDQYVTRQSADVSCKVFPEYFTDFKGYSLITGNAGSGKTTFMHSIFMAQCNKYLEKESERIPVLLSAKLWCRDFDSVIEGVFKELNVFNPNLTAEIIENMMINNEILLLVDGLDECSENRDLLIKDIFRTNCSVVISSRLSVIDSRLYKLESYKTSLLSENKMIEISSEVLKRNMTSEIYRLSKSLKEVLYTPIYFNMFLTYEMNKKTEKSPSNIAELYHSFTTYLLKNHVSYKGNSDVEQIPINNLQKILSNFAFTTYGGENVDIVKLIRGEFPEYVLPIYKIFLQSGLIFETTEGCEFQQYSLKEYYYAQFLLNNVVEHLDDFLKKNINNSRYEEVILILVGLNKNKSIQDKILDYLLEKNLTLYVKCLKRRYNFSVYFEKNKDKVFYEDFFGTIHHTYQKILDIYFLNIQKYMLPFVWEKEYNESLLVGMKCGVDVFGNSLSIQLNAMDASEQSLLDISYKNESPVISVQKEGGMVPISFGSLRSTRGLFHYELNILDKGIDYAREIAIDMIYYSLETLLDEDNLVEYESPLMIMFFIEEFLKSASPLRVRRNNQTIEYNLSLRHQSISEILDIFNGLSGYNIKVGYNKLLSFKTIGYLIYVNKDEFSLDFDQLLFPEPLKEAIGNKRWVWNYYTDKQIIDWITNYYKFGQIAYRAFIKRLFPNLIEDFSLYQVGPIQYNIEIQLPDRDSDNSWSVGGVHTTFNLVDSIADSEPRVSVVAEKHSLLMDSEYYENLRREARFYNRKLTVSESSSSVLTHLFDREKNPRSFVYEKLRKEFKNIFKP